MQSFADVPITDAGVDTVAFLEASDGLVGLFGKPATLGSETSMLDAMYRYPRIDRILRRSSRLEGQHRRKTNL